MSMASFVRVGLFGVGVNAAAEIVTPFPAGTSPPTPDLGHKLFPFMEMQAICHCKVL